ncbi:hypothetical protein RDWZM_006777 [Blomia tropicalis]|uniref:CBF1-interacting co-repressor CIR N-terminal domain-containing protein n=1 Tax=Blomia tropicalis TaxID=40697 RepID=A0A9Q0M857_BLOTA|nr:hypothetical protein RDWZM_006777 [Blomia tropicalis]
MNILPHKSWHVRTKQNISRVRRDEEKAKQEEETKQRRIKLAEHEARIKLLRSKSGEFSSIVRNQIPNNELDVNSKHVDLFENFKDHTGPDGEREAEKKTEQEKWEVKTGIFSYLDGRYKHDSSKSEEWYLQSRKERYKNDLEKDNSSKLKDDRLKYRHDPLNEIKAHLSEMKKRELNTNKVESSNRTRLKNETKVKSEQTPIVVHSKKHKKRKKHKRHRSSSSETSDSDTKRSNNKNELINRLRLERLDRERKERLRAQQFLNNSESSCSLDEPSSLHERKYNSQFNPHIARQNQPR